MTIFSRSSFWKIKSCSFTTLFRRQPFIITRRFGAIKTNTIFVEERLGLTHKRPSYRPTGTHPSPRSVLEWRSANRSTSLSSTSRPTLCTHGSLMGNYRSTSLGRNTWKTLIGSQASLQLNCNKEGFNAVGTNKRFSRARIGIIGNEQNNCDSCDSRIGFGIGEYHDDSNTCGNEASWSSDNGDKHIRAVGYILVQ